MDHDALIAQFASVAGVSPEEARHYLATNNWHLNSALAEFFASQEDSNDPDEMDEDSADENAPPPQPPVSHAGGRRLGDGSGNSQAVPVAPPPSSSSQPRQNPKPTTQRKFATLDDFAGSSADPDDNLSDEEGQDLFAGGEKSGLAVQNPDDLKRKILEKAMKRGAQPPRPEDAAPQPRPTHFTGPARTLGGDETPSREIPAEAPAVAPNQRVERVLHFWNDGFSIDDGELYRSDDPRNADILNSIRQGRAPLSIMNVMPGQEVDVELKQHNENYVKPKKKYVPFSGQGQRLGGLTPGFGQSNLPMPGSFTSDASSAPAGPATVPPQSATPPTSEVDESRPTVSLRISLHSGTRLTSRFNTTQTVGDVYEFTRRADPSGHRFVLQTTFPTRDLTDQGKLLGDLPDFKRGGAVVQKYV